MYLSGRALGDLFDFYIQQLQHKFVMMCEEMKIDLIQF